MIKELPRIKTLEEYEKAKQDFEYYSNEYKWISEAKDPRGEIESKLKACMQELRFGMEREEELQKLKQIHNLKTKYILVVREEYKPKLVINMQGLGLMLDQFEASEKNPAIKDTIKGVLQNDKETKEYLRGKYMVFLSNMYGLVPAPENLNLESASDILEYMNKNYDLVTIDLSAPKEELGLVQVNEQSIGMKKAIEKYVENKSAQNIEMVESGGMIKETPIEAIPIKVRKETLIENEVKNVKKSNRKDKGEIGK